ncbi:MAG TPA: pitrilysin family protein, partial [Acidimicrobiales bacterium]|nr:pitrilysin family protein [Acidimicrobiales bacterium]
KEYTTFEVRLRAEQVDLGLDILSDIVWSPAFRPEEVEAERSVILEELLMAHDEPADLVHDLFLEAAFPDHPLGRSTLGTEETIEAMSPAAIAAFHAGAYRPDRVVVAAAGALDHDRIVEAVAKRLPDGLGSASALDRRPAPPARGVRKVVERPTEQVHVVVGTRTAGALHDDRFALEILTQALGGGISSRLFQEVREERGLAYSVYAYRSGWSDAGVLAFYAGTTPATAGEVVDLLAEGFDRVGASGLGERELAIAQGQVVNSSVLGLEDSGARMHRLGHSQLVHGRVEPLEDHLDRYARLTLDDVGEVARRLVDGPLSLATIGPVGETAGHR